MISQKLHDAMNEQINAELWSAYLYLSMSLDAEARDTRVWPTGFSSSSVRSRTMPASS